MFSIRIRDSPYKKSLSTLEEGSRVKLRGPEMAFLGNPESGVEFSSIHLVKFAEACNSKGYAIKEPDEVIFKMNQAINERKPTIVLKEIHTHYVDKKCQGGK
jgi:thiamine pyrophosphate-dependent acetolactate synthase large subunit-like protein